jgi:hypothetical protein
MCPAVFALIAAGIGLYTFLLVPTTDADADIIILTSAEDGV